MNANLTYIQLANKFIISISCLFQNNKQTTNLAVIFGAQLSEKVTVGKRYPSLKSFFLSWLGLDKNIPKLDFESLTGKNHLILSL